MSAFLIFLLLLAGLALGVFFYGGLWLTVRSLPTARHPAWLTLCSFSSRTLLVLVVFLFLMKGGWQHAIVCLLGFTMGRLAVSRYLPAPETRPQCPP
jgi:F1F0 ATPase subunit 2